MVRTAPSLIADDSYSRDDDKANDDDIESPAEPSSTAHAPSSSRHLVGVSAEPPRWRFVADAKGTSGYSTLAAGQHVTGKSSEELASKYIAPDVSLYKEKRDERDVGKLQHRLPTSRNHLEKNVEVGRLEKNDEILFGNDKSVSRDENIESGRNVLEKKQNEVLGLLKELLRPNDVIHYPDGEDDQNENSLHSDSLNCIELNSEASPGEVSRTRQNEGHLLDDQLDEDGLKEGTDPNSSEVSSDDEVDATAKEKFLKRGHRFLYLVVLLLLVLVVVLGVSLGKKNAGGATVTPNSAAATPELSVPALISKSTSSPSSHPSAALTLPEVLVPAVTSNSTSKPSSYPSTALTNEPFAISSLAPTGECNAETKAFSIEHPKERNGIAATLFRASSHATWILKNACSGEVVTQCYPCSLGSLSLTSSLSGSNEAREHKLFTRRTEKHLLQNITGCLPTNNEYVFEVQSALISAPCCGFDPATFIISFDSVALTNEVADGNGDSNDQSGTYFFGESEAPCKSGSNSSSPSGNASQLFSSVPSHETSLIPSSVPSTNPTMSPMTDPPTLDPSNQPFTSSLSEAPTSASPSSAPSTASPVAFLGECPESYGHLSTYTIGARVESNGLVYQCIDVSCRSYGLEPGRRWKVVGECSNPTLPPPTDSPTKYPYLLAPFLPYLEPSAPPVKQPSGSPSASPAKATTSPINSPTRVPSLTPTESPSKGPTNMPSALPNKEPTPPPMKQPSAIPSKAPAEKPTTAPSGNPTARPTVRPSANPSKKPTNRPSATPSKAPTEKPTTAPSGRPSARPTEGPSVNPSKKPTDRPTAMPSSKPSTRPTLPPPTSKPTSCSADPESFSICLGINMSGSLCNGPTGALCIGCPQIYQSSDFQDSYCRDVGVEWNSCCSTFADAKELAKSIVNLLGGLPVEKSFSVVQFASDARVVSGLSSTSQTLSTISQLTYSGGLDNHASAIQMCQQTLSSSSYKKKIILLLTDGETGTPDYVPEGSAESGATSVKNEGTYIYPIFISPDPPDIRENTIFMLSRISSIGKVFDFTDGSTSSASQEKEELLNHVSCSHE